MKNEKRDLPLSVIFKWFAFAGTTIAVVPIVIWFVYHHAIMANNVHKPQAVQKVGLFPEPRLQNEPRLPLSIYRAKQKLILDSYSNAGAQPGTVQVPIERAMEEMSK